MAKYCLFQRLLDHFSVALSTGPTPWSGEAIDAHAATLSRRFRILCKVADSTDIARLQGHNAMAIEDARFGQRDQEFPA